MKTDDVFSAFLKELSEQIEVTSYSLWFSKISIRSIEDNTITIIVPLQVHKTMLSENYKDLINQSMFNVTGKNYEFSYITELELEEMTSVIDKPDDKSVDIFNSRLDKNLTFDNFVVGEGNRLAYIASKAVAEAPGTCHNPLFLYGKCGLGKSHLIHSIGNYITNNSEKVVLYTTSNDFMTDYVGLNNQHKGSQSLNYMSDFKNKYRNVDVLIIDDIQFLVGAELTQQEFFHTFNALHQLNKQIIITSDKSPDDLKKIEDRLTSRFKWGLPVNVAPPDFHLRCSIIKQKLSKFNMEGKLNDDVIEYIANSCFSDVRHIEGTIQRLNVYSKMMLPKSITLDFAIEALKDYLSSNIFSKNSIENIQTVVAEYFGITVDDMKSKKRTANIIRPRHIAIYLSRNETDENLTKIGLEFGGRDHSTIVCAYDKIKKDLISDENLNKMLKDIKEKL